MPCRDTLWDAADVDTWRNMMDSKPRNSAISLEKAVSVLVHGDSLDECSETGWEWSPFGTAVTMHGVAIHVWHLTHSSSLWRPSGGSESFSETATVLPRVERALSRCRKLLLQARSELESTWNDTEGPFLFNSFATLRVSYSRVLSSAITLDRFILLKEDIADVMSAIQEYVVMPQERDEYTTKAVAQALQGFIIPIRAGTLLLRKTAALTWSIEHALVGWDNSMLLHLRTITQL
jgi:hypothetical protein